MGREREGGREGERGEREGGRKEGRERGKGGRGKEGRERGKGGREEGRKGEGGRERAGIDRNESIHYRKSEQLQSLEQEQDVMDITKSNEEQVLIQYLPH